MKKSRFAQNRVDYIVFHNPEGVKQLVYDFGYHPPKSERDLARVARELAKSEGEPFISKLLELHPEKSLLSFINSKRSKSKAQVCKKCGSAMEEEDGFCGCGHSNYDSESSFDVEKYAEDLDNMTLKEIKDHYEAILAEANENPTDATLAEEVQFVWNTLRKREQKSSESSNVSSPNLQNKFFKLSYSEGLMFGGLLVVAGILIGAATYGKPAVITH